MLCSGRHRHACMHVKHQRMRSGRHRHTQTCMQERTDSCRKLHSKTSGLSRANASTLDKVLSLTPPMPEIARRSFLLEALFLAIATSCNPICTGVASCSSSQPLRVEVVRSMAVDTADVHPRLHSVQEEVGAPRRKHIQMSPNEFDHICHEGRYVGGGYCRRNRTEKNMYVCR